MKKSRIVWIISVLCVAVLCVLLLAYWGSFGRIDAAKFIQLYNSARYGGKGTGEGGTPEFGVVYCHDGTILWLNDFGCLDREFEVGLRDANGNRKAWYYVNGEELYTFVLELADKCQ